MITEHTVAEAAAKAGIRAPAVYLESTGSTNTEAVRLAERGAPEWTLVVADQQEAGRGRLGRTWVSTPGASLLLSLLLRPAIAPEEAPLIALWAGATMAAACRSACGVEVRCKWPNDLVVGERKLGGILVEGKVEGGRLAHAVVGAGVNVVQRAEDFPSELRPTATSIALEGGRADRRALLVEFLRRMSATGEPGEPAVRAHILQSYRRLCSTIGRTVRATTASGREVGGLAMDVGPSGELVVEAGGRRERVLFGELEHLR